MAAIDWNEFIIVEKIEFVEEQEDMEMDHYDQTQEPFIEKQAGESIEQDMDIDEEEEDEKVYHEIAQPQRAIEKIEKMIEDNKQAHFKDDSIQIDEDVPDSDMKIVKNYTRPAASRNESITYERCPLCKLMINIGEWSEHLRIELLDPKWKEVKKDIEQRKKDFNLSTGNELINYLNNFCRNRPDLFGDISQEIELEEKRKEVTNTTSEIKWDGQAANMSRTTANVAMLAQQIKRNYEDKTIAPSL